MGPVSFDTIDLGPDRDPAMEATAAVVEAGYRVEIHEVDGRFRLLVRNTDIRPVRSLLDARHTA